MGTDDVLRLSDGIDDTRPPAGVIPSELLTCCGCCDIFGSVPPWLSARQTGQGQSCEILFVRSFTFHSFHVQSELTLFYLLKKETRMQKP